jgi:hypothetical protein
LKREVHCELQRCGLKLRAKDDQDGVGMMGRRRRRRRRSRRGIGGRLSFVLVHDLRGHIGEMHKT